MVEATLERMQHSREFTARRTQNWLVLGLTYAAMYMARYNFPLANKALSDAYGWDKAQVVVQSLKSRQRKILVEGGSDARYLPTGHLVYALGGSLFAVVFGAWAACWVKNIGYTWYFVEGASVAAILAVQPHMAMLALGRKGIAELIAAQRAVLARLMVTPPPS